jgi:hypothetical protein
MANARFAWNDTIRIELTTGSAGPFVWSASAADHRGGAVPPEKVGLLAPDPDGLGAVIAFEGIAGSMQVVIREPGRVTKIDIDVTEPPEIPSNVEIFSKSALEAAEAAKRAPAPQSPAVKPAPAEVTPAPTA